MADLRSLYQDNVSFRKGLFYIHTDKARAAIDRVSNLPGIAQLTDLGIGVFLTAMLASFGVLLLTAVQVWQNPPPVTAAQDPVNMLAIPGLNDFLPLSAAGSIVIALFIAAGIHELGHGVALRHENIDVEEVGIVILGLFPIAAYVQPDEEAFEELNIHRQTRVFAAGVFCNLVLFAVTSALFLIPGIQNPAGLFFTYFGKAMSSTVPQSLTYSTVAPLSELVFWTWFFNINLAFVNVLPIAYLDGGQIIRSAAERITLPGPSVITQPGLIIVTTVVTLVQFTIAVFGPLFLS